MAAKAFVIGAVLALGLVQTAQSQDTALWELICENNTCAAVQLNANADGRAVMRTEVVRNGDNSLLISVRLPNAVMINDGPWLTVSGVYLSEMEYLNCFQGCVASVALPVNLAEGLLSASEAVVTVIGMDKTRRGVPINLVGLRETLSGKP